MNNNSWIGAYDWHTLALLYARMGAREAATFRVAGAGSGGRSGHRGAEAAGRDSKRGHIFLGLKQDDVNLWSKEAAEHHRAAQGDGNTHGGGLHLSPGRG